jgi:hypothetical protein
MGEALRHPSLLTTNPVPLSFDGVPIARRLEVIDRVKVDERDDALRRIRPGLLLELSPPLEELSACTVPEATAAGTRSELKAARARSARSISLVGS